MKHRRVSTAWAARKAAEIRRQIDQVAASDTRGNWRCQHQKARTLDDLRARESRMLGLAGPPPDDFEAPF